MSEPSLDERLAAERDERRRIAEGLHDGPVQYVAALAQMLDAAARALDDGDAAGARAVVARALEVAREAAGELRELVHAIEPATLHEEGFAAAVAELARRMAARRGIRVEVDAAAGDGLGPNARVGLYQIAREAVDQAARRGPPSLVELRVVRTGAGGAELVVVDDGSPERRQAVVDGLAERAATLNGTLDVARGEDGRTIVRVTLPPSAADR